MAQLKTRMRFYERLQRGLAVVMVLMVVGFYFLEYRPQERFLHALREQVGASQQDLRTSQQKARALPDVASDVRALRARLDRVKRLPPQEELSQTTGELAALGQQLALHNFRLEPGASQREDLFNSLQVSLNFDGDFVDVVTFLRKVDEMQRLTRVKSMQMQASDTAKPGQVTVQVAMNLYFSPSQ